MKREKEIRPRSSLTDAIRELIRKNGRDGWFAEPDGTRTPAAAIPFRDYMAACLYDERHGYYTSGELRVGKEGDFYTSAAIGGVMAAVLANYIRREHAGGGRIPPLFEWGAGTGRLGVQLLEAWRTAAPAEAEAVRYAMVDGHPGHRAEARRALAAAGFGAAADVLAPDDAALRLSAADRPVVLANELLDAFPVRRFRRSGGVLWEIGTAWDERSSRFRDAYLPLSGEDLARFASEGLELREGQEAERGTDAIAWLEETAGRMNGGALVLIDYGDVREELLGPHRMNGTLLCYAKHRAHADPYQDPGKQDMTAHVDFTAVRGAAARLGWQTAYYATQKQFLLDYGVLDLLQAHRDPDPFSETARRNRAVRQLLLSDGMSELFKVLVLRK